MSAGDRIQFRSATQSRELWIHRASELARQRGSAKLMNGGFGNHSFSAYHTYLARYLFDQGRFRELAALAATGHEGGMTYWQAARTRVLGPLRGSLTAVAPYDAIGRFAHPGASIPEKATRRRSGRAEWLHTMRALPRAAAAAMVPASYNGLQSIDPFGADSVRRWAVELDPVEWQRGPGTRAFARRALRGLVPDRIRLNERIGMQSADLWWRVSPMRDRLNAEADLLVDTPGFAWVDPHRVKAVIAGLPWGAPVMDSDGGLHELMRLLTLAASMRWLNAELGRRRREKPPCAHPSP